MLVKRAPAGVLLILTSAHTMGPRQLAAQSTGTVAENNEAAVTCPPRLFFNFQSEFTGRVYDGTAFLRGASPLAGRVRYYFTNARQMNGNYTASGNFWLWGLECRMNNWGWFVLSVPSSRVDAVEIDTSPGNLASCGPEEIQASYDPYSEDGEDCNDGGSSGGGNPTPSDTPYYPGQSTGGETVDWNTGVGDGGSSMCGMDAVVEYVCIDVFNEDSGNWQEWSCGYATTC